MRAVLLLAAACILASLSGGGAARALEIPKAPLGRVSDYAGLLAAADRASLDSRLEAIEKANSNQFAVAIFKTLEGEDIEGFSIRLAEAWKIGQQGKDNGAIIVLAVEDRKVRIEVGRGLEGAIPDITAGKIIRDIMTPAFRNGDWAGGLTAAVDALDKASRGEFTAETKSQAPPPALRSLIALLALIFIVAIFQAIRGRSQVIDSQGRRSGPWFPMGGFGGGGFGGGGGGFSGGGGSFGGGGASGSW